MTPFEQRQTQHKEVLDKLHDTYVRKNKDYGDSFNETIQKYGAIAGLTRISDKFRRIEHLILTGEQHVKDEALEDTLLDLANYAIMMHLSLKQTQAMRKEDENE